MKKIILISTMLVLSLVVFTGCTKTVGQSVSSINPSVTLQTPQSVPSTNEAPVVPTLNKGSEINDLESDLSETNFNDVDIEVDSSL